MSFPTHSQEHRINKIKSLSNKMSKTSISPTISNNTIPLKYRSKLIQVDKDLKKILTTYDKLTLKTLPEEEIFLFSSYLSNLYKKASKNMEYVKGVEIEYKDLSNSIKSMSSTNIHDKIIGIDTFMSLAHSDLFLVDLVFANNNIDVTETESSDDFLMEFSRNKSKKVISILNQIRNRKNLNPIVYDGTYYTTEKLT